LHRRRIARVDRHFARLPLIDFDSQMTEDQSERRDIGQIRNAAELHRLGR
jgi:hypothetical protein